MTDQGRYDFHVVFTMSICALELETDAIKFAISSHAALKLGIQVLRSYLKLIYEYELPILPNTNVGSAKDHGKN